MSTLLLNVAGWIGVLAIAVIGLSILRAVRRMRRGGLGVHAEERRLRDDPRFAGERVQQMASSMEPESASAGDPAAAETPRLDA